MIQAAPNAAGHPAFMSISGLPFATSGAVRRDGTTTILLCGRQVLPQDVIHLIGLVNREAVCAPR